MVSRQINKVVQQQDLPAPRWTACRATGFPPALSRSGAAHGGMEPPIPPVPMAGLFGALPLLLWLVATHCGGNAVGTNRKKSWRSFWFGCCSWLWSRPRKPALLWGGKPCGLPRSSSPSKATWLSELYNCIGLQPPSPAARFGQNARHTGQSCSRGNAFLVVVHLAVS